MGFGEGLGQVIGASMAADKLSDGQDAVNGISDQFGKNVAPYNSFGQSFLQPANEAVANVQGEASKTKSYDEFMKNYTASPGVQYQMGQALEAQNESAAAKGGLLSGTNQRALSTISQGIASTGANAAFDEYLKGDSQHFGQLETSLGNMFQAIGVGQQATGQQAGVDVAHMNNDTALAQAQAKNDQAKGSGFGSMFAGLSSFPVKF